MYLRVPEANEYFFSFLDDFYRTNSFLPAKIKKIKESI
jgi:hypothetical protein